jgi:hypothetical protein
MEAIDPTVPIVKNLLLLDSDGKRIAVKYYSSEWATSVTAQSNFEKSVFAKTRATNARGEVKAEVALFDNVVVLYKFMGDLLFYVTASQEENELVMYSVLEGFHESVNLLLRGAVEKKTVLENLDLVLLAMDEIIDGGLILETDAQTIAGRVTMRGAEGELPLAEQTLSKAFANAREQFTRSLLR